MKLVRYENPYTAPANAFNRLFELGSPAFGRLGSLFDDFFSEATGVNQPAADLYEDDQNFYARLELPGQNKEDIDLELENSVLTVRGGESQKDEAGERSYHFERSISVPEGVDLEKVSANYEDGILTVTMPKEETRKPRQISVE